VPFNSTEGRGIKGKSGNGPGPGQYSVPECLKKEGNGVFVSSEKRFLDLAMVCLLMNIENTRTRRIHARTSRD